jgi:hypothetical protein
MMINSGIEKTFERSSVTIDEIDSIVRNQLLSENEDTKLQEKMLEFQEHKFKEYLSKMNDLKKGVFDSNTITFMVSFVLVFLGGILFGIEERAKKQIDKSEYFLNRVEIEQEIFDLYTQIQMIKLSATNLQSTLSSKNYKIDNLTNILVHELFKMITDLLQDFHDEKYKFITQEKKKNLNDTFSQIRYAFGWDRIKEEKKNIDKTSPIEATIERLEELKYKVLGMKELKIKGYEKNTIGGR